MLVLIVEPNKQQLRPFGLLDSSIGRIKVSSVEDALKALHHVDPDLIFISASLTPKQSVTLLESLQYNNKKKLIPIIFFVNLNHRLNFIPGTTWDGRIAVIDCFVSKQELKSTINRVINI